MNEIEEDYYSMDTGQIWDIFVGSQTEKEFMSFTPNDTVEIAVENYIKNQKSFFENIDLEIIEHIKQKLMEFIIDNSEFWAKQTEAIYSCDFKRILDSQIPLTSRFDNSVDNNDFRISHIKYFDNLKNQINEIFDIQCYNMKISGKIPYWESIIAFPENYHNIIKTLID